MVGENLVHSISILSERLSIYNVLNGARKSTFAEDVRFGLGAERKFLKPKYFYDDIGSVLFEKICKTKEYYVTRTEAEVLRRYGSEISKANLNKHVVIELGSGSSVKTRYIIDSFISNNGGLNYIPIDVSDIMISSSQVLVNDYSRLKINGVLSEYEDGLEVASSLSSKPKMILFLGSSIGNFDPAEAHALMNRISNVMNENDSLLIGFDLVKDEDVLNAAYNDAEGYTADFNLNLLKRINNELKGEFNLSGFEHSAFFNREKSRVEMHLVSLAEQDVCIHDIKKKLHFRKGETIHTENSHKFTDEMINDLARQSGLAVENVWKDEKDYFALCLMSKV